MYQSQTTSDSIKLSNKVNTRYTLELGRNLGCKIPGQSTPILIYNDLTPALGLKPPTFRLQSQRFNNSKHRYWTQTTSDSLKLSNKVNKRYILETGNESRP